jgi:type II secretory pathway component GspD/PulD (secretin)
LTLAWISIAVGVVLVPAGVIAQSPDLTGTGDPAAPRPAKVHTALRAATDCYRRGDYELAATFFEQAQLGQADLSATERQDLATWLELNNAALKARREGSAQLQMAEQALQQGRTPEALSALKGLTSNQQFLTPPEKQRVQQLMEKLIASQSDAIKTVGSEVPPPQVPQARTKLKQARMLLARGQYDAAQALALEVDQMGATYQPGEDTPQKVLSDISNARAVVVHGTDAKSYLTAARAALQRGDLDTAEMLAHEAEKASSLWSSVGNIWRSDSPSKVLKDVQTARAKQPKTPRRTPGTDAVASSSSMKPYPSGSEETSPAGGGNADAARRLVQESRQALQAGNLMQAKMLALRARALNVELNWWEETPEKILSEIRVREGNKSDVPADVAAAPPGSDPKVLFKQAQEQYEAGNLDEAEKLALRASANKQVRWGLFDSSPDKLLLDIRKAKAKHDQDDSGRVLADARKAFEQGQLDEAERLAHRAERMHGPYGVLDLGDRPQKLLADIDAARQKGRPNQAPPPGAVVRSDPLQPVTGAPAPAWPDAASQSPYTPRASGAVAGNDIGKARAQMLLTEARQLQKEYRLVEARQKALEAQKIGASFSPDEDRPELVLLAVSALCQRQIETLVQRAGDYGTASLDATRYQRALSDLTQARQLAVGFGFDTHLIDTRITALHAARDKAGLPQSSLGKSAIVQASHQETMPASPTVAAAGAPDHGRNLLEQARMELRAGQTATARKLAEAAFEPQYGVQTEAAAVLRSIDAEEFNQKVLTADRTLEAGLAAFNRREYAQANTMLRTIDGRLLAPEKQVRLKEVMLLPEMQSDRVARAGYQPGAAAPAAPGMGTTPPAGRARATDMPGATMRTDADFAQQVRALQEVKFQSLRSEGLEKQSEAMRRFAAGDTDQALELLQEYTVSLKDSGLDADRQALLRRPVEARLQQLRTLKHQRDFEKLQSSEKEASQKAVTQHFLAEQEKKKQMAELMKQYQVFFKEGKYQDAETYAMRAHELDPDDPAASAAIYVARIQKNQMGYKDIKKRKEAMVVEALDQSEDPGPYVDSGDPLHFDAKTATENRGRKSYDDLLKVDKVKNEKEREIYRKLDNPINSLDFKDTPLRQILDDLQGYTGINIVPDEPALNEAGISLDRPVTMKLEGVALKSALNLVLHQVHLTYVVKDEVLNVTTEDNARGKLVTRIHPVLDLVMPIENTGSQGSNVLQAALHTGDSNLKLSGQMPFMTPDSLGGATSVGQNGTGAVPHSMAAPTVTKEMPKNTLEEMLIKLITGTVAPQSWASVGGQGTIDFYPLGMALVINQTPDIQEQVSDLLQALRRLQDQEVAVEVRFITIAESFYERIGVDFNLNIRQNNTKYAPQIVSQQFQPFGFVNSFTPKNFLTGLTAPGGGGVGSNGQFGQFSQDLNIPIHTSSFEMAIPPFGQYPNAPGSNGGLELGLAFLSDIEVFLFMEAAQGDMRTNVMQAPKLTLFNGQTSTITATDEQFFVTSVTVAQLGGQVVFVPNNTLIPTGGVTLAIQAVISADRRFVRLNLAPALTNLTSANVPLFPITTFITPILLGGAVGQPIPFTQFLQQPAFNSLTVNTTVNVPDGGTVLMGGLKRLSEGRNEFGPPILSKLPYINRLFKNVGYGREAESLLMMVTPRVIINEEEELRQVPGAVTGPAGAGAPDLGVRVP